MPPSIVIVDGESAIILEVCRSAGPDISTAMNTAIETMSDESVALPDEIIYIGIRLMNCDREDVLLSAYTTSEQFRAYQNDDISEAEFRASWQWDV